MGLFSKLKSVLTKTRDGLSKKLTELFSKNKLGDDFYEELEDILISSDVSVQTSIEIVDEIREQAIKEKCKDKDYVIGLLKKELLETLDYADQLEFKSPCIIMVVGVNGVGKPPLSVNLLTNSLKKASRLQSLRQIPSVQPHQTN